MEDSFGRRINYLRISVTDRCNLRCRYCMPEEGVPLLPKQALLSFEEIADVVRAGAKLGIDKVRFTGGEPLLRHEITKLVAMVAEIENISDLCMSTNGILLDEYATSLRRAGLQRVNVSLDAINPLHYSEITRGGDVRRVFLGIRAAECAGLLPIKLNCVVRHSSCEKDARQVANYAREHGYQVRFIKQMNLSTGEFWVVEGGNGGDCVNCSRLRLSSDGYIRPCLFSDLKFSVRELGPERAIRKAVETKPEFGVCSKNLTFQAIGG